MSARRFGTQSLVRLLGNWQETSSRTPLWRQLAEALRLLILDGRLTLQTRLPGERELAAALNVSRTTIASALGQLREEGFLYSRQGSGSRIVLPERPADLPLPAGISEIPAKPLSDSKLTSMLSEQGIMVARRTVAKYRESLSIPPSNQRKQLV